MAGSNTRRAFATINPVPGRLRTLVITVRAASGSLADGGASWSGRATIPSSRRPPQTLPPPTAAVFGQLWARPRVWKASRRALVTTRWPARAPAFWPAGKKRWKEHGCGRPRSRRPEGPVGRQQWLVFSGQAPTGSRDLRRYAVGWRPCCDATLVLAADPDGPATAMRRRQRQRRASSRRTLLARHLPRAQRWGPAAPGCSGR